MTTNDAIAHRVLKLMQEKGYSQYKIEQKSSVYRRAMSRILNFKNKSVTLATVYKLARGFDMTIIEFLDDELFANENIDIE